MLMGVEGIVSGIALIALAIAGILRSSLLLAEAKSDREDLRNVSEAIEVQAEFYVKTNYVHITKYCFAIAAGVLIIGANTEALSLVTPEFRQRATPVLLIIIISLAVFLGELEAKARRYIKDYYRRQRRGG